MPEIRYLPWPPIHEHTEKLTHTHPCIYMNDHYRATITLLSRASFQLENTVFSAQSRQQVIPFSPSMNNSLYLTLVKICTNGIFDSSFVMIVSLSGKCHQCSPSFMSLHHTNELIEALFISWVNNCLEHGMIFFIGHFLLASEMSQHVLSTIVAYWAFDWAVCSICINWQTAMRGCKQFKQDERRKRVT